jgi:hypothetical protein
MKRRWILGGVVAVAGTLLLAGAATSSSKPLQRSTPRRIEALAMDGSRVAYDVSGGLSKNGRTYICNAVYVWNLSSGTVTKVSGKGTCAADTTSTGAGVRELALAGGRTAWIVNTGGTSESDDDLYVASLPHPKERHLAAALRTGENGGVLTGDWIGGLVGAKSFLGVNRWTTDSHGDVDSAKLQVIRSGLHTIASGVDTMRAGATDGKQIAVMQPDKGPLTDETVALYSTTGQLLRVVTPKSHQEVALSGDYLAVLTRAQTLMVYNSHSGKLLHTWRVAVGAAHLDVSSGLAAYAAQRSLTRPYLRNVHVLSLSTGKDRIVATTKANGPGIAGVQLEPAGLVYANNYVTRTGYTGALVFMPMARLR